MTCAPLPADLVALLKILRVGRHLGVCAWVCRWCCVGCQASCARRQRLMKHQQRTARLACKQHPHHHGARVEELVLMQAAPARDDARRARGVETLLSSAAPGQASSPHWLPGPCSQRSTLRQQGA
jgi:hypothetical protein